MKSLALVLVAASALAACAPKVCDPAPMPDSFKDVARFLPASAVVCGTQNNGSTLLVNFPSHDVMKLSTESMAKLAEANWSLGQSDAKTGFISAMKNGLMIHMNIADQKNGGPYLGHVTGSLTVTGKKK